MLDKKFFAQEKSWAVFFAFVFSIFQATGVWAQSMPKDNSCVTCHEDVWDQMKGSIHGQQGISCERCHGGDPTKEDMDAAKAPGTGFIGVPTKQQTAQVCGQCHADVETMNFYGIRTDQLARYKTSHHGKKLLLEGDINVAVCSDCHGYHNVVKIDDPSSPVYPLNLPKTCAHCHADKKLMDRYGLPSDIFDLYKSSVHGQAVFEKKNISAAHCAACHGSHGAVPPGVKDVSATCGKCHVNEKKYFMESAHAKATEQGKFSECVSCHGNHEVGPASLALYEKTCVKCHDAQSHAAQQGRQMLELLRNANDEWASAQAIVKEASIEGLFVDEETASLEEAKTNMVQMAPLQHTLSVERVSDLSKKVVSLSEGIKASIAQKRRNLVWRKILLIPIWIFVTIMVIVLGLKYKELKKRKHGK